VLDFRRLLLPNEEAALLPVPPLPTHQNGPTQIPLLPFGQDPNAVPAAAAAAVPLPQYADPLDIALNDGGGDVYVPLPKHFFFFFAFDR